MDVQELREQLRQAHENLTLDTIARVICETYDESEVRLLLEGIERHRTDN